MNDQASTLRLIAQNNTQKNSMYSEQQATETNPPKTVRRMRSIAISGGKGGVGKSNLSVNLALALGSIGNKVSLLDADFGLANADLLCGVTPKHHLGHVIAGWKELDDIAVQISNGVQLIPSGSGIEELANISVSAHTNLLHKLEAMERSSNFMLIDTAAGISENVTGILISADEIIIVATPDPTSIVDAYATIKIILRHSPEKPIFVVVNNVVGVGDAEQVFEQVSYVSKRFLKREVNFLGMIPNDDLLVEAVREQIPVLEYAPEAPSSRAIKLIAKQIHSRNPADLATTGEAQSFWNRIISK